MIGHLSGKILERDTTQLVLDVSGVGYSIFVPERISQKLQIGQPANFVIHTNLRENALELFGFSSKWEKKVFLALLDVSGIGPKTALHIVGAYEPELLLNAILRQDIGSLTKLPGVGKKTAERISLELVDKARKLLADKEPAREKLVGTPSAGGSLDATPVSKTEVTEPYGFWNEAIEALVQLGYRDSDALVALREVTAHWPEEKPLTLENLVRLALQFIAKARHKNEAGKS